MANVLDLMGYVANILGAPQAGLAVTLKNNSTGATVGSPTTTDADGKWVFDNQDETLSYEVEVAVGGASSQVISRRPWSGEMLSLYVRNELRTNASATVAFGGAISVAGQLTVSAGGMAVTGTLAVTGAITATTTIAATTTITAGTGLTVTTGGANITGTLAVTGAATVSTTLGVTGNISGSALVTAGTGLRATTGGLVVSAGGATITGNSTITGTVGVTGTLTQGGGYALIGGFNAATGPTYPAAGTHLGVAWNYNSGSRDISLFNTDTTPASRSFGFHQLLGASSASLLASVSYHATYGGRIKINGTGAWTDMALGPENDPNTGIWFPSADVMRLGGGGAGIQLGVTGGAVGYIAMGGQIWLQNSGAATGGGIIDKFPIYNMAGTLLGYVPIYAS